MDVNFDAVKVILVVGLTIVGVVIINVLLYFLIVRSGTVGQINLMRKATGRIRNPWQDEDDNLNELAKLVRNLKDHTGESSDNEEPGKSK